VEELNILEGKEKNSFTKTLKRMERLLVKGKVINEDASDPNLSEQLSLAMSLQSLILLKNFVRRD
jgi:hypothetical protein